MLGNCGKNVKISVKCRVSPLTPEAFSESVYLQETLSEVWNYSGSQMFSIKKNKQTFKDGIILILI